MSNVVIFGKAHAGKSTLLGYLIATTQHLDLQKVETDLKKEIGIKYQPEDFYRYIVDDTKYERNRQKNLRTIGATVERHIRRVNLSNDESVTIIDTPGGEHREGNRIRGMFFADIGVFCIEMKDVLSDDFYKAGKDSSLILSSLKLWLSFENKEVIVALTKSDLCDYSEKCFFDAKERIEKLCYDIYEKENLKIVPISIDTANFTGHNIIGLSSLMSWYKSETLCESIVTNTKKFTSEENAPLFFCIDRQIQKPQSSAGKVWRIKILSGKLNVGDRVILSPVLNNNKQFVNIEAEIKTIRADNHESEKQEYINCAYSGDIVGIDLKNIYDGAKQIRKSFDTIYSTCGFSNEQDYKSSNYFRFSIERRHEDVFKINRQLSLIWLGRPITFSIRNVEYLNSYLIVDAEIQKRKLTLPIGNHFEKYKSIIIRESNERLSQTYNATFIKLIDKIGEP